MRKENFEKGVDGGGGAADYGQQTKDRSSFAKAMEDRGPKTEGSGKTES